MDYATMDAGPEMNALVAIKVMGWIPQSPAARENPHHSAQRWVDAEGQDTEWTDSGGIGRRGLFNPSTDLRVAIWIAGTMARSFKLQKLAKGTLVRDCKDEEMLATVVQRGRRPRKTVDVAWRATVATGRPWMYALQPELATCRALLDFAQMLTDSGSRLAAP